MNYFKTVDNDFFRQRLSSLFIAILIFFTILISRLFYLQIIDGNEYYIKSENNCFRLQKIPPHRGLIFDINGELLVDNRPSFEISITPKDARPLRKVVSKLSGLLDIPEDILYEKVKSIKGIAAFKPTLLKKDISRDCLAAIEVNKYDLPGVNINVISQRHYIKKNAVHLIGYLGEINSTELSSDKYLDYRKGDLIGKFGVEKAYEKFLRGKWGGKQVEIDVTGQVLRILNIVKSQPGDNLFLTIDDKIQAKAEELISGKKGAIVVMDPNNGLIIALVSSPVFDPDLFIEGMSRKEWNNLVTDKNRPLQNRAIQGEYPPGSVYKIVTAMAALEEKIIDETNTVDCPGYYKFGIRRFKCWKGGGHGIVNINKAISESCDVFFYHVGQQLGVDRIAKYAKMCGLGKKTGILIDRESTGLIPTSHWKVWQTGEPWIKGETLSIAIGQGYNLVTPLQCAVLISAIANGGILYKPQVVDRIETVEGKKVFQYKKEVMGNINISSKTLEIIRKGLWHAVNSEKGTAFWFAKMKDIDISGKTGTSQVISQKDFNKMTDEEKERYKDHAWFVAYAPSKNCKIAVAVLIEHGEHGSSGAAPIAKEIIKLYLKSN